MRCVRWRSVCLMVDAPQRRQQPRFSASLNEAACSGVYLPQADMLRSDFPAVNDRMSAADSTFRRETPKVRVNPFRRRWSAPSPLALSGRRWGSRQGYDWSVEARRLPEGTRASAANSTDREAARAVASPSGAGLSRDDMPSPPDDAVVGPWDSPQHRRCIIATPCHPSAFHSSSAPTTGPTR